MHRKKRTVGAYYFFTFLSLSTSRCPWPWVSWSWLQVSPACQSVIPPPTKLSHSGRETCSSWTPKPWASTGGCTSAQRPGSGSPVWARPWRRWGLWFGSSPGPTSKRGCSTDRGEGSGEESRRPSGELQGMWSLSHQAQRKRRFPSHCPKWKMCNPLLKKRSCWAMWCTGCRSSAGASVLLIGFIFVFYKFLRKQMSF